MTQCLYKLASSLVPSKIYLKISTRATMSTCDQTTEIKTANETPIEDYAGSMAEKQRIRAEKKAEAKRKLKERRAHTKETKEVGFNLNDSLMQTDYYFDAGLRKVYPYFFFWNTTAKERWFGRTIHEIYKTEFSRAVVNQPLEKLITTGKIKVNGQTKSLDYVIKNGDRISHAKHRHEIPVLGDPIRIVHEDNDYLVVDKPCSIPMHPCGKYRYNSLSIILAKQFFYKNLRTLYRLDRLTSGCVILGKNFQAALVLDKHIKDRTAVKTYIARVIGEFPKDRQVVDQAIDCASRKIGLYWLDSIKGKESLTEFERVNYDPKTNTSVVKCWPKTGRTHQIRIHLQYLGHPIVNDPLYNQPTVWGKGNGKDGVYEFDSVQIEKNFLKIHTYEAWIVKQMDQESEDVQEITDSSGKRKIESDLDCIERKIPKQEEVRDTQPTNRGIPTNDLTQEKFKEDVSSESDSVTKKNSSLDKGLLKVDPECFECSQTYRDPTRKDLTMYLHALSYKFGDREFKTEVPTWAHENFVE